MKIKLCKKCHRTRAITHFARDMRTKFGRVDVCNSCRGRKHPPLARTTRLLTHEEQCAYAMASDKRGIYGNPWHIRATEADIAFWMAGDGGVRREASEIRRSGKFRSICERYHWRCMSCGQEIDPALKHPDPMSASLGHAHPVSRGGTNSADNLIPQHWRCNLRQHDNPWHETAEILG